MAKLLTQNVFGEWVPMTLLHKLMPREEQILRLATGFGEERPYSDSEIAERFAVGRERIRQLRLKATKRLVQLAATPGTWPPRKPSK